MRLIVREPVRENFLFVRIIGAEYGEQAGVEIRQGVEILAINVPDPLAILLGVPAVSDAYEQCRGFS